MLARLGGRTWERQKGKVQAAVSDMAADMLELQASRASRPGISFHVDTEWQHEFDASFPYQETTDQLTTIDAIKHDMSQPRPMDRLLCGDVGYGKTEVAMRAAFKAVDAGYQVAVLVPTTVLAEQHSADVHRPHGRISLRDRRPVAIRHAQAAGGHYRPAGGRGGRYCHRHPSAGAAGRAASITWAW